MASNCLQPCKLIADLFSDKFETAKAWSEPSWQRCFVSGGVDENCYAASTAVLVETYTGHILRPESDNFRTGEVVDVCNMWVRSLDCFQADRWMRQWKVFAKVCEMQVFPFRIMRCPSSMAVYLSLNVRGHQISFHQWIGTRQARFHEPNAERMFAVECSAIGVILRKSSIHFPDVWQKRFSVLPMRKWSMKG